MMLNMERALSKGSPWVGLVVVAAVLSLIVLVGVYASSLVAALSISAE